MKIYSGESFREKEFVAWYKTCLSETRLRLSAAHIVELRNRMYGYATKHYVRLSCYLIYIGYAQILEIEFDGFQ